MSVLSFLDGHPPGDDDGPAPGRALFERLRRAITRRLESSALRPPASRWASRCTAGPVRANQHNTADSPDLTRGPSPPLDAGFYWLKFHTTVERIARIVLAGTNQILSRSYARRDYSILQRRLIAFEPRLDIFRPQQRQSIV